MKQSSIYDQGGAPRREDGLVLGVRVFGVLNGTSAPFAQAYPQVFYGGLSGGEVVVRAAEEAFLGSPLQPSILGDVARVNDKVRRIHQFEFGIDVYRSDLAHGATFAIAQIRGDKLQIAQVGECLAIFEMRDGTVVVSPNQLRAHDTELNAAINSAHDEVAREMFGVSFEEVPVSDKGKVRGPAWNRVVPLLGQARLEDWNQKTSRRGLGVLSGHPGLMDMLWHQEFPVADVATALFMTNGLLAWSVMTARDNRTDLETAKDVLAAFKEGGLPGLLAAARNKEAKYGPAHYVNNTEATGVALEF